MSWRMAMVMLLVVARYAAQPPEASVQVETKPKHIQAGAGTKLFEVTRHLIPLEEIRGGGPPRDGIPALDHPAFIPAAQADQALKPSDMVMGIESEGAAKAYPIRILNWHEVVNDDVGRRPVLLTW